jgi:hypothetical protein
MLRRMADLGMLLLERVAEEKLQSASPQPDPQAPKPPDAILAFSRICRCVRDTMALEARIAAGKLPAAPRAASDAASDPRRPAIKNFILELIDKAPQPKTLKASFREQLDPLVTEYLENDPEQDLPPCAIILEICEEIGLPCSTSDMPDELLIRPHRPYTEAETAAVANEVYRRIHGHDPP